MVTVVVRAGVMEWNAIQCWLIQKYFLIPQSQIDSKLHHISLKCQFAIELTVTFLDGKKKNSFGFSFVQCALQESYSHTAYCISTVVIPL